MKPRLKFWEWLDAYSLEHEDIADWPNAFEGYGYILRLITIFYVRLCLCAGAREEDFEL